MKRLLFPIFVLVLFLQGCTNKQPEYNYDYLQYAVIWYQNSPEQKALYYQGFNVATRQLEIYAKDSTEKPKAVVVDIDETMLDNSPFEAQEIIDNRGFSDDFWFEWTKLAKAAALPGAVEFSQYCQSLGVEVFYVSNRKDRELEATLKNLDSLGFAFARPENLYFKENESSKKERREKISEKYEIVMLIGDNLNDFSEVFEDKGDDWGSSLVEKYRNEFGTRFIILPNPMYGEWEKSLYKSYNISDAEKTDLRFKTLRGFRNPDKK